MVALQIQFGCSLLLNVDPRLIVQRGGVFFDRLFERDVQVSLRSSPAMPDPGWPAAIGPLETNVST